MAYATVQDTNLHSRSSLAFRVLLMIAPLAVTVLWVISNLCLHQRYKGLDTRMLLKPFRQICKTRATTKLLDLLLEL